MEHLDESATGIDALDEVDAIELERVARSHSVTTRMSPLPSSSMAFSSSGLPLVALPLALSR